MSTHPERPSKAWQRRKGKADLEGDGDVVCHLNMILARAGMYNMSELSRITGIWIQALRDLRDGKTKIYDSDILARLCYVFHLPLHLLLEYVPPERQQRGALQVTLPTTVTLSDQLPPPEGRYGSIRCLVPARMREWEEEHQEEIETYLRKLSPATLQRVRKESGGQALPYAGWHDRVGLDRMTIAAWNQEQRQSYSRYTLARWCRFFNVGGQSPEAGIERIVQYDPPSAT